MGVACAQGPSLRIRVLDYARVPVSTLRNFGATARAIFRAGGIDAEWPTCRVYSRQGECGPMDDRDVYLKIVAGPAPSWRAERTAFGTTIRQGGRNLFAYIFWGHVEEAARRQGISPSVLLGHVVAHEAGHLLGLEHTENGIMDCAFSPQEMDRAARGKLHFSPRQAAFLRSALLP